MQSVSSNAVANTINAYRVFNLYGVGNQVTVNVTPTTGFTALTKTVQVEVLVAKKYTIIAPIFYKVVNAPTTSYQLTMYIRVDNTEIECFSVSAVYGFISTTLFANIVLSEGTHNVVIGAKVANNQKVVNIEVPYYNIVKCTMI